MEGTPDWLMDAFLGGMINVDIEGTGFKEKSKRATIRDIGGINCGLEWPICERDTLRNYEKYILLVGYDPRRLGVFFKHGASLELLNHDDITALKKLPDEQCRGLKEKLETTDNWAGRKTGMVCKTCVFYVPKKDSQGTEKLGRCRASPPTMRGFPVVYPTDWCGGHRIDENKI
ncbi:hypothetical protein [Methanolapillus millepedarum]